MAQALPVIAAVASTAAAGATVYQGQQAAKAQKRAANQATMQAEMQQSQAEREFNRANQKRPNVAALAARNRAMSGGGVGGTFLTGTMGAPTSSGMLGRTSLLGS
jgi:type II secretory pathway pseudopilin PulG